MLLSSEKVKTLTAIIYVATSWWRHHLLLLKTKLSSPLHNERKKRKERHILRCKSWLMTSSHRLLLPLGASLTVNLSLSLFRIQIISIFTNQLMTIESRCRRRCREEDSLPIIKSETVSSFSKSHLPSLSIFGELKIIRNLRVWFARTRHHHFNGANASESSGEMRHCDSGMLFSRRRRHLQDPSRVRAGEAEVHQHPWSSKQHA